MEKRRITLRDGAGEVRFCNIEEAARGRSVAWSPDSRYFAAVVTQRVSRHRLFFVCDAAERRFAFIETDDRPFVEAAFPDNATIRAVEGPSVRRYDLGHLAWQPIPLTPYSTAEIPLAEAMDLVPIEEYVKGKSRLGRAVLAVLFTTCVTVLVVVVAAIELYTSRGERMSVTEFVFAVLTGVGVSFLVMGLFLLQCRRSNR